MRSSVGTREGSFDFQLNGDFVIERVLCLQSFAAGLLCGLLAVSESPSTLLQRDLYVHAVVAIVSLV